MHIPPGRTLSQNDGPETIGKTNPVTIKPETASHTAAQFSWVPLPCYSPPRRPSIQSLALSARVSPWRIPCRTLDKRPLSGPGRGPPPCDRSTWDSSRPNQSHKPPLVKKTLQWRNKPPSGQKWPNLEKTKLSLHKVNPELWHHSDL